MENITNAASSLNDNNPAVTAAVSMALGSKMPTTITMPVDDFIAIPDNPQQRDTAYRADRAKDSHLAAPAPSHAVVSVVQLPDGRYFKTDGHTRSYLWDRDLLAKPAKVLVTVYQVADEAGAIRAYEQFDNSSAVKSSADRTQSAYHLNGLTMTSGLLRGGQGMESALRFSDGLVEGRVTKTPSADIALVDLVAKFGPALLLLDALGFGKRRLHMAYIIAALVILMRDGEGASIFLSMIKDNLGINRGGEMDAIHMVTSYPISKEYIDLKARRNVGPAKLNKPLAVILHAYSVWEADPDSAWFVKYQTNTKILSQFFADK